VALANGTLMSFYPADAPAILATVIGRRLTWIVGCIVVGSFRWWLGIALLLVWQLTRRPILQTIRTTSLPSAATRPDAPRRLLSPRSRTKPAAAKELRVFGLGPWIVDRYRTHWAEGMAELWRIRSGTFVTTAWVGVVLVSVYVGACGVIAKAAYDGDITLAKVAVLLPVLFLTMTGGTVGFDDISLEWQLSSLPELDALERDLSDRRIALTGAADVAGKPLLVFGSKASRSGIPVRRTSCSTGSTSPIPAGSSTPSSAPTARARRRS